MSEKTTVVLIKLFKMFSVPVTMHPQIYLILSNQYHTIYIYHSPKGHLFNHLNYLKPESISKTKQNSSQTKPQSTL